MNKEAGVAIAAHVWNDGTKPGGVEDRSNVVEGAWIVGKAMQ
jgi:hypothetical protein